MATVEDPTSVPNGSGGVDQRGLVRGMPTRRRRGRAYSRTGFYALRTTLRQLGPDHDRATAECAPNRDPAASLLAAHREIGPRRWIVAVYRHGVPGGGEAHNAKLAVH